MYILNEIYEDGIALLKVPEELYLQEVLDFSKVVNLGIKHSYGTTKKIDWIGKEICCDISQFLNPEDLFNQRSFLVADAKSQSIDYSDKFSLIEYDEKAARYFIYRFKEELRNKKYKKTLQYIIKEWRKSSYNYIDRYHYLYEKYEKLTNFTQKIINFL